MAMMRKIEVLVLVEDEGNTRGFPATGVFHSGCGMKLAFSHLKEHGAVGQGHSHAPNVILPEVVFIVCLHLLGSLQGITVLPRGRC